MPLESTLGQSLRLLREVSAVCGLDHPVRQAIIEAAAGFLRTTRYHWGGKYRLDACGERRWVCVAEACEVPGAQHDHMIDCSGLTEVVLDEAARVMRAGHGPRSREVDALATAVMGLGSWQQAELFRRHDTLNSREHPRSPGDLLFWDRDGRGITHVGLYLGREGEGVERFIHASAEARGVAVTTLTGDFWRCLVGSGDVGGLLNALSA